MVYIKRGWPQFIGSCKKKSAGKVNVAAVIQKHLSLGPQLLISFSIFVYSASLCLLLSPQTIFHPVSINRESTAQPYYTVNFTSKMYSIFPFLFDLKFINIGTAYQQWVSVLGWKKDSVGSWYNLELIRIFSHHQHMWRDHLLLCEQGEHIISNQPSHSITSSVSSCVTSAL